MTWESMWVNWTQGECMFISAHTNEFGLKSLGKYMGQTKKSCFSTGK